MFFPVFGKRLCVWPRFKVENGENVDFMYFVVFVGSGEKVENGENRENPLLSLQKYQIKNKMRVYS